MELNNIDLYYKKARRTQTLRGKEEEDQMFEPTSLIYPARWLEERK